MANKKEPSIMMSPKYGVNPSIPVCFLCGEDKNEIILPGRIRGKGNDDIEAPRKCVWNTDPCDKCKEHMIKGIICISVDAKKSEDHKNPYRTGGWCVIKEEAVRRVFQDYAQCNDILKKRVVFLEDEVWDIIGLPRGETKIQE